jgi:hypothetical protein
VKDLIQEGKVRQVILTSVGESQTIPRDYYTSV